MAWARLINVSLTVLSNSGHGCGISSAVVCPKTTAQGTCWTKRLRAIGGGCRYVDGIPAGCDAQRKV